MGTSTVSAGPTDRNRSAPAAASVPRSTGSFPGGGGRESNRASHSMSSTSRRIRPVSPWIRDSESRYPAASRGTDSATSVSAWITASGVRNSCEASAVNSSWRRRACSTGASARRPTTSEPRNMAATTNGPAMISASRSRFLVCASPAMLCPATSQPVPSRVIFILNCVFRGPSPAVTTSPSRAAPSRISDAGRDGAPGVRAVTVPSAFASHRYTGAESASRSSASRAAPGPLAGRVIKDGSLRTAASWLVSRASLFSLRCALISRLRTITAIT